MTLQEAAAGLKRGDFSRLAPLFGDPSRPEVAAGLIVTWLDAGVYAEMPDVLAEALRQEPRVVLGRTEWRGPALSVDRSHQREAHHRRR